MRRKRSSLGVLGVLATLMAFVAVSPAQATADSTANDTGDVQVLTAPPAPERALRAAEAGVAAVSPTISPSAPFIHVSAGAQYTCENGNLCTAVWDPVVTKWKVFKLYNCNRYSLSNWLDGGDGTYRNPQTGNPTSYFYNQSGGVITSFKPFSGQRYQNWAPVWSIRNC